MENIEVQTCFRRIQVAPTRSDQLQLIRRKRHHVHCSSRIFRVCQRRLGIVDHREENSVVALILRCAEPKRLDAQRNTTCGRHPRRDDCVHTLFESVSSTLLNVFRRFFHLCNP